MATLSRLTNSISAAAPALLSRPRALRWAASAATVLVLGAVGASPAAAANSPWFRLTSTSRPGNLSGETGELAITAVNVGDAAANASGSPLVITDHLPAGLRPIFTGEGAHGLGEEQVPLDGSECQIPETRKVVCTFSSGSLISFHQIEVLIGVRVEAGAQSGEVNEAIIEGGGAPTARAAHPITVGPGPTPFGVEDYEAPFEEEGGELDNRAGSHPFQYTTTFDLKAGRAFDVSAGNEVAVPAALAKDVVAELPPGQLGNATAYPQCSTLQFLTFLHLQTNLCPVDTIVGVATVTYSEFLLGGPLGLTNRVVPIYNLEPGFGEPARFGFAPAGVPTILDTSVRSDGDYGVDVTVKNVPQIIGFLANTLTFWGVPGDPRHDSSRSVACLEPGSENGPCEPGGSSAHPPAFLTLPTACSGAPLFGAISADTWFHPGAMVSPDPNPSQPLGTLHGCGLVPFGPTIGSSPTSNAATSPTGLSFDINFEDEGLLNAEGLAQSQLKKAVVTLPQGFTTNPSVAEGLKACSEAEYEASTLEANSGCTSESKVGEVEITSPLVRPDQVVKGGLYVATQQKNPYHNLLTLYLVARNAEIGVLIKQALKVIPDPVTGQLTTEVDDVPQLPFSHFHLAFRSGQRSPLVTPPACGPYTVKADLYPWSDPGTPTERESSFQITQGAEGQPCPSGGLPPFHPNLEAGTLNNAAGTYSPFVTHITRKDSEQEITHFSIKLPPGVIGKLAGVSECSDAGVAAAKGLEKEGGGALEEASPSCPKNSEVGHSLVGSGVGNVLAYAPGRLYLAGPYHGSPISIVSITAAKVGPFDLGTVVVRFALNIDHETAEVSVDGANSDPIPHIVDGIPVHLRDIRAYVDRPNFTLNPTSCAKKSTASTILGSGLDFVSLLDDQPVTVSSPFQAADCASLGFKPALKLSLGGKKTHRGALPAFKAVLTYPKHGAYANIAKAQVTLPPSEILEQAHLEKVCPKSLFTTGSTPGENCPASSIYGTAKAWTPLLDEPLEGPVFLRTGYGTVLPELTATLNNKQIHIVLAGKIDSVQKKGTEISRIRNTFELVPDAPVSKFVLEMKGGKKGLLVNKTNICKGSHRAIAAFTAQNGKLHEFETPLKATACAKKGKK
jgi:hypothetical protein